MIVAAKFTWHGSPKVDGGRNGYSGGPGPVVGAAWVCETHCTAGNYSEAAARIADDPPAQPRRTVSKKGGKERRCAE